MSLPDGCAARKYGSAVFVVDRADLIRMCSRKLIADLAAPVRRAVLDQNDLEITLLAKNGRYGLGKVFFGLIYGNKNTEGHGGSLSGRNTAALGLIIA